MTKKTLRVQVRRAYEAPEQGDGTRVLVDRLWPRGLAKATAHIHEWCKEVAPSTELRKWYHHDPALFGEFTRRYHSELMSVATRKSALMAMKSPHLWPREVRSSGHQMSSPLAEPST